MAEIQNMPQFAEAANTAQWTRMMQSIGQALAPVRVDVLNTLTDMFTRIGSAAGTSEGAQTIKEVAEAILILAAGLVGLGSAAVLITIGAMLGPGGWLAALVPSLRSAVSETALALMSGDIEKIKKAGGGLGDTIIRAVIDGLVGGVAAAVDAAKRAGTAFGDAIRGGDHGPEPLRPGMQMPIHPFAPPSISPWSGFPSSLPPLTPHPFSGRLLPGASPFGEPGWETGARNWEPGGSMLQNQSWEPGNNGSGGGGTVQVHNVIYLDGTPIMQAMNDYTAAGLEHPRQAPYFDGRSSYTAPDYQPISS